MSGCRGPLSPHGGPPSCYNLPLTSLPWSRITEAEIVGLGPATCHVFVPCVLQKFKEYVNGSNLITKLQAKHDLLKQTLGEGESGGGGSL